MDLGKRGFFGRALGVSSQIAGTVALFAITPPTISPVKGVCFTAGTGRFPQ
jgi:hypothetical protein